MNLAQAVSQIERALARMSTGFRMPLFDEWTIFAAGDEDGGILHYSGTRSESLQQQFRRDLQPLLAELDAGQYEPGHFYFTHEGEGARYDAFLCVGRGVYAVFNHTTKSMVEITADPLWRAVQVHFVDLSARFRVDPLR
jgi:hypothetical protein